MSHFHSLKVSGVVNETADCVSVSFDVPTDLKAQFAFLPGQYLTLRATVNGEDVRRSYSLSSAPFEGLFRIAVKRVDGGRMSSWITGNLREGMELQVMPPQGNFKLNPVEGKTATYVAFVAGSGITPVLSMIKSVMRTERSQFILFYGNKALDSIIYKGELNKLVQDYPGRLHVYHVLSREGQGNALLEGRISGEKAVKLLDFYGGRNADAYYLCGPGDMIMGVEKELKAMGVDAGRIHHELFTTPVADAAPKAISGTGVSRMTVIMDGMSYNFDLAANGDNILDAAMSAGVDAPFSCKGAVCCTCKAKIVKGTAEMEMNYALTDSEVAEGFVLTCQAHPTSEEVTVDYDVV
jgi:ring-1,2-phenylacetyl-CoA epoxidase subunit PaaE